MDKIFSINTIKNVFAALGAKTSDDNYGVALLDKTTAEPKGLMEMSDLASVLKVPKFKEINANTQLSSLDSGVYNLRQAKFAIDAPSDIASSTYTYMYIATSQVEILMPIDSNSTVWYSRYNYSLWVKHG